MEFLTFHVGEREFAVDLSRVSEIVNPPPITRVPGMPPALLGLVGLRGDPTAVVDAGLRLAGRPVQRSARSPLIVLTVRIHDRPMQVGLLVEAAGRKLDLDTLLPWTDGLARFAGSDACTGFGDVEGQLVLVLNVDQLLAFDRIAAAGVLSLPEPARPAPSTPALESGTALAAPTAALASPVAAPFASTAPAPAPSSAADPATSPPPGASHSARPAPPTTVAPAEHRATRAAAPQPSHAEPQLPHPAPPSPGGWAPFSSNQAGAPVGAGPDMAPPPAMTRRAPQMEAARYAREPDLAEREAPALVTEGRSSQRLGWLAAAAAIAILLLGALLVATLGSGGRRTVASSASSRQDRGAYSSAPTAPLPVPTSRPSEPPAPPPQEPPAPAPSSSALQGSTAPPTPVATPAPAPTPPQEARPQQPKTRAVRVLPPELRVTPDTPSCEIHEVKKGESLWLISARRLGDPYLWPKVYGENRDHIFDPNVIEIDDRIRVPGACNAPGVR
jgi:purine-binding chemotaxis protein CheW